MPTCSAIHKRLARFTAKRKPIPPGDGRCVRQISVYNPKTGEIMASRCLQDENHESPHRFRGPGDTVSQIKFVRKDRL